MLIDSHTHIVPVLPDFAARYGDQRWPTFKVDGDDQTVGRLTRNGAVVRAVPPTAWDLDRRVEEMDRVGVDRHIMSPLPPIICDWADPEPAQEWCLALNEGIAAAAATHPDRFDGLGTVPLQHPDAAVAVLENAHQLGLAGVEIGTTGGARELDHPDLRGFFAAAAELEMLIYVHPLILGANAGWTPRIEGQAVTFGLGMTTDTAIAGARLIFGGVMQASPNLRVCLSHGGGTLAWALPRIAKAWDQQADQKAAELMTNVYVDSVVYGRANLRYLVDTLGAEQVLFGTDYPLPAQDDLAGGVLGDLTTTERTLVGSGNAARALRTRSAGRAAVI
jgi:aminocarboxymuconate-semialdehyde decarboxylase